jgi:hypothetical protein
MLFASPGLLVLSLFGNAGTLRGDTARGHCAGTLKDAAGWDRFSGVNVSLDGANARLQQNKPLTFHGVGLKVRVSRVWTDTARPFMV